MTAIIGFLFKAGFGLAPSRFFPEKPHYQIFNRHDYVCNLMGDNKEVTVTKNKELKNGTKIGWPVKGLGGIRARYDISDLLLDYAAYDSRKNMTSCARARVTPNIAHTINVTARGRRSGDI